jgi:putative serine/threonine protein kinase
LKFYGVILTVFSSLTKKEKVDEFIKDNLLEFEELDKKHIFFEDLYAYSIKKSDILKKLEKKGINNIKYFAKGKRGFVFKGEFKNKIVGIKIKNPESKAILRTNNEINFLKILNKKNIGPKLLFSGEDFLVYEFVKGPNIGELFSYERLEPKLIKKTLVETMQQMYEMDKMKINKEEMSHPHKHIIIDNKYEPVLIDFERAHYTIKPSNVTQFSDFLISKHVLTVLKKNNIKINKNKIISLAKKYKGQRNKKNFNKIIQLIK